jgi:hypothetical protein
LHARNFGAVVGEHQDVLVAQGGHANIQNQCLALAAVNFKALLGKNTAVAHRANHASQLGRGDRMPAHQAHRVGAWRGLNHSPHLVDDQVGAANHRQHLSGTIAQRRCGHEATLTLTLATGHRVHAQDADQQTYHARDEGD